MELEDKVMLAVKRIEHILKHESNEITSVTPDDEGSILIHLSNGMNLHLTSGEMEFRAYEQLEVEFKNVKQMQRDEIRQAIADDYIRVMNADALEGDNSLLNALLMGEGMTPINTLPDDRLIAEYKNLFDKDVIIND
jgi:hypothetical protein